MTFARAPWALLSLSFAAFVAIACGDGEPSDVDPEGTGGEQNGDGDGDVGGMGAAPGDGDGDGSGGGLLDEPPPVPECPELTQGYATEVISHEFGPEQTFGQEDFPDPILGGPQGKGCCAGSLDVVSLGDGGFVELGFGDRTIIDGDGPDFIVSENPFWAGGDMNEPVAELAVVSVSADGETWVDFPCEPGDGPTYGDCAGWRPVLGNVLDPAKDPFDVETAGGDQYDLSAVGLSEASFVRITDIAGDEVVFDLDAVTVVNGQCN